MRPPLVVADVDRPRGRAATPARPCHISSYRGSPVPSTTNVAIDGNSPASAAMRSSPFWSTIRDTMPDDWRAEPLGVGRQTKDLQQSALGRGLA